MRPARKLEPIAPSQRRSARALTPFADRHAPETEIAPAPPQTRRSIRRIARNALLLLLLLIATVLAGFRVASLLRETQVPEARAPASGRFVETGNGRMFLQDVGPRDRIPIVLVHGTAAWSEFWRGTIDHLANAGHRVIALDLPPFGFSDRSSTGAYSRADQAKRIVGALDTLNIDRAIFVGHSFGAGATVETVMQYPERAAGLILVAAALGLPEDGTPPTPPSKALDTFLQLPLLPDALVSATLTNPLLTRMLLGTMIARKEAATAERAEVLRRPMTRSNTTADFIVWLRTFLAPDLAALSSTPANYRKLSVPTKIIWGDADTLTPLPQGARLSGLIPNAEMEVLPTLGHIPQIEGPEAFRPALDRAISHIRQRSEP